MRIDLCICTFRRASVADTILSVAGAQIPADVDLRILVIDNDATPSARQTVADAAGRLPGSAGCHVEYHHVPGANISLARNAALDLAGADWIAFLDDDEIADPGWLAALIACAARQGADAVFGPSVPIYPPDTPGWMVEGDFHRQDVPLRDGKVQTGHTCNALLRWAGTAWCGERFDLRHGRSGGEDTAFFGRVHARGAAFARCDEACVREPVPRDRLSLRWLLRRRFRVGQTYGEIAGGPLARAKRLVLAAAKAGYCGLRILPVLHRPAARAFWLLRGTMHAGVCAGCIALPQADLYGAAPSTDPAAR
ncbi:MAG: glycosyltransferase [Rhodobacteraceae bacterium]|nr:glycosyltransferase [Paracoccaceae bacterium]